jgi:hypothetical protein
MPDAITGLAVGGTQLIGGLMGADAAESAASAQAGASEAGIAEQRRQFDLMRQLLQPYTQAGAPALQAQQAMLGLGGPEAEAAQIAAAERSPTYQAMLRKGEESMLQRASATGGLRGGNMQAALAQFRPQLLAQELENRYNRFAGLTALGQQSASGVGTAGIQTGANVANLEAQRGAALAGGHLGQAQAFSGLLNAPMTLLGMQYGAGGKMGLGFGGLFNKG